MHGGVNGPWQGSSTMSDRAALLQAVAEHPDDDARRLVLADWLEENGEEGERAWADFIRAQCALARLCRPGVAVDLGLPSGVLPPHSRRAALRPLLDLGLHEVADSYTFGPPSGCRFVLKRGLIEEIEVFGGQEGSRLVAAGEKIFSITPLRHLRFVPFRSYGPDRVSGPDPLREPLRLQTLASLVRLAAAARLQTLDVRGHDLGDGAAWLLLGAAHITPQTQLFLGDNNFSEDSRAALRERFGRSVDLEDRFVADGGEEDDIPF
jgi:uncharacterized protein (TIGR02996 family)